ncbi:MAG: cobalt-precorrin-5B (C(1))-methyltransferase CbiD [Candidatus Hydrothermarchaeaceae archaeon]
MELYVRRKGELLRRGLTTGTCAAAAAKAAALAICSGEYVKSVSVELPNGEPVKLEVYGIKCEGNKCSCYTVKDAGDDPDVTHGAEVWADVEFRRGRGVVIKGGVGVGAVTKPGLQVPVGEAAINPVPRGMIRKEVERILPHGKGAVVKVSVPRGAEIAKRTMNPRLGILDGISIIGTTGVVEPKSVEAFRDSLVPQIDVALAVGHREVVLTPGRRSEKIAVKIGIPQDAVVQTGNFVGFMLEACASRDIDRVLLFGSLGKLSKLALGYFYTHSGESPRGVEVMARHATLAGVGENVVEGVRNANTTDEALGILRKNGLSGIVNHIAEEVTYRAMEHVGRSLEVGTVLISLDGEVVGRSNVGESSWARYLS